MYKDKRVEKKKTVTMKRNLNPIFNESFAFDIPTEKLRETTIIITVMDKDRLSRNDVIGKVGARQVGCRASWRPARVCPYEQQRASGPSAGLDSWRDRVRPFPSLDLFHLKMKGLDGIPPKRHTVDRSAEGRLLEGQGKK